MYTGVFIFDFNIKTEAIIKLLIQLKGNNRIFFALTEYDRGDLEYALGYTIGNKIVADTQAEESYELLGMNTALQWFEPKTEEEMTLCIEMNPSFYAGCILEEGMQLCDALYIFHLIENYREIEGEDLVLFIGAKDPMKAKIFMYSLEAYQEVLPPGHIQKLWVEKESSYAKAWASTHR